MNKRSLLFCIGAIALLGAVLIGCDLGDGESLYDPDYQSAPAPVISSVDPPELALAGVGQIVITGQNFSSNPDENLVYFNERRAILLESSATQLIVRPPNFASDDIVIKVAVLKAVEFSNEWPYVLELAVEPGWGGLSDQQAPYGIASDADGNIYTSVLGDGEFGGIKQITPDQERSDYAPRQAWVYPTLLRGPDGNLYAARGPATFAAIYTAPPGGVTPSPWLLGGGLGRIRSFDFDQHGNIWGGGNNNPGLYRVTPDKEVEVFEFDHSDVRSVRVFDGAVYVAAITDGKHNIWRFPFTEPGEVGEPELYFAFSDSYGLEGAGALAITFSAAGELFIGTNGADGLIIVYPDKSWEPFYPGTLSNTIDALVWGPGQDLFASWEDPASTSSDVIRKIVRINTQRQGAPNYGW
jgi:hypothetical protein